jgi:hypothetical protein
MLTGTYHISTGVARYPVIALQVQAGTYHLQMGSTSSCKNFRFFGQTSEKLCLFYRRYGKLCVSVGKPGWRQLGQSVPKLQHRSQDQSSL